MPKRLIIPAGMTVAVACGGGGTGPGDVTAHCDNPVQVTLAAGTHQVVDPRSAGGCVRLGGADPGEQYLVVAMSAAGEETQTGVSGAYTLRIGDQGTVSATGRLAGDGGLSLAVAPLAERPEPAWVAFEAGLRAREAGLRVDAEDRRLVPSAGPGAAPSVGDQRTFQVCANSGCNSANTVNATARAVGQTVAIFADNSNPVFADTLRAEDYDELVTIFDQHLHPISVAAFGSPSDIDGNGVVLVLITRRVNDFTTNCSDGRVIGYFFGGDLLTTFTNSNRAEVFFTYAPAPASGNCSTITRRTALNQLKATLIHEFQHMISFNQHRLIRGGNQEQTWLNEALSHLAEDLAGQLIPNADCPGASSCRSLFATANVLNVHSYWVDPTRHALVFGRNSTGTLAERGAGFLFARWVLDQFGTGTNGFAVTRALVGTNLLGAANLAAVTAQPFGLLAGQWLLTSYVDNLAGFADESGRLSYDTWDFRTVMNNPANSGLFPNGFPLTPEVVTQAAVRTGELKGGTGRYFRIVTGGAPKDLLLSGGAGAATQPDQALQARLAIVRLQ